MHYPFAGRATGDDAIAVCIGNAECPRKEYQPHVQSKSDLLCPAMSLLDKLEKEFQGRGEVKESEAMKHIFDRFKKIADEQKEKERIAADEKGAEQQSLGPLSREANENELGEPDDELQRAREAQKEKRKQNQALAQKIRELTKKYTGQSSNQELVDGMDKFIDDVKNLRH